jgi:hypothetical protein
VRCDNCPTRDDCATECDSMYDDEESVFDEDDHLFGDYVIDPEMGAH